ncbi:MAG: DUF1922 domain-containing protein [Thaumarchaeota archaeon]|nr:DUF1922 domain-containing protein [Candidatus Calditenuaceae archaeon]MDW8187450.1 DUF1922 domain-containing protein [Nitrososphaerota archaeon]
MGGLYYVVRCLKCSGISVTRARKVHKCPFCGERVTINDLTVLHVTNEARRARQLVSLLKERRSMPD